MHYAKYIISQLLGCKRCGWMHGHNVRVVNAHKGRCYTTQLVAADLQARFKEDALRR